MRGTTFPLLCLVSCCSYSRLMDSSWFKRTLPTLLFSIISALGATTIFTRSLNRSFLELIIATCDPGAPLNTKHLGVKAIDAGVLCLVASFFEQGLQPLSAPYTTYFLINFAPVAFFMFSEGSRPGKSLWISSGAAASFGLLCQVVTGGVAMPLYFLTSVLHAEDTSNLPIISKSHAEATAFAFFAGFFLPTFFLVYTKQSPVILLWQPFPLWMYISQRLHLLVWPPPTVSKRERTTSGRHVLQALYTGMAITSALAHISLVWPIAHDIPTLRRAFIPHFIQPNDVVELVDATRNLLQWDATFTFAGATVASLWFGRNISETTVIALWCIFVGTMLGPGAALSMIYAWRENQTSVSPKL